MNEKIKTLALTALASALIVSACNNSDQAYKDNLTQTDSAMSAAPIAADTQNNWHQDWEKFKADSRAQIKENEDSIEAFRRRVAHERSNMKVQYDNRITELKARNERMQVKLDSFREKNRSKWEVFKTDFKNDMDTIGYQLKELAKK